MALTPPHFHQNNEFVSDAGDFEALPGDDVNGSSCACNLVPVYRDADGRFAKPGLAPIFQAPVTAAVPGVGMAPTFDLSPIAEALAAFAPQPVTVTIPDGAIVINLPDQAPPVVHVAAPAVNVQAPTVTVEAPTVSVEAPAVNVQPPVVNVEAPVVTVEPTFEIPKPAPPKMLPPPKPRETRIIRDNAGTIIGMEEVT